MGGQKYDNKKINEDVSVGCATFFSKRRWGHEVRCFYREREVEQVRVYYQNRTWESYEYETALLALVDRMDKTKEIPLKDRIEMYNFIKLSRFNL